jgi:hypothetical protein
MQRICGIHGAPADGVGNGDVVTAPSEKSRTVWGESFVKSWAEAPAKFVVGLLVAILGGLVVAALAIVNPGDDSPASVPTSTVSSAASDPFPTDNPSLQPSAPAPLADVFSPVPLTLANATERSDCDIPSMTGYDWDSEISSIAAMDYTSGMSCKLAYRETSGYLEYLVPPGATHLTVVAGQPDDARNTTITVRFQVIDTITGAPLVEPLDLVYGQSAALDVPLAGAIRVTLQVDVLSYEIEPHEEVGAAGWAEPTFR